MQQDILKELKDLMEGDNIQGRIAAELHDITEQYNEGILTKEEYEELINDVVMINQYNDLADDEVTSRWLVKIAETLISVV